MFSFLNRLSPHLQSSRRFSKTFLSGNRFSIRWMCSSRTRRFPNPNLYSKINRLGGKPSCSSVVTELDKWVENGRKVRVAELQRILRNLRRRRSYSQALQVSEWMDKQGICSFSPSDHAVRLDLIGHVHGLESAETYFNNMSDPDRTIKAYGALLNCYVRAENTTKSLALFQKMKDMGFSLSHLIYNNLMSLYTKIGEHEEVPRLFTEMKELGVSPDNFSYRICINSYGARSNIEAMERVLEEMENKTHISIDWSTYAVVANSYMKAGLPDKAIVALKRSEQKLDRIDGPGYTHLISLYARLGNKDDLLRLWQVKKAASKRHVNMDYIIMLGSLVKLGEFEEAERLLGEYGSSGNSFDFHVPNVVLLGYSQEGEAEKAEAMVEDLVEKGKKPMPSSWSIVAAAYAKKGEMRKAVECMKRALSMSVGDEEWSPVPSVTASMLRWLGEQGVIEEVETFVEMLKAVVPMNRDMYHALNIANLKGGRGVESLLERMKAENIDGDEEIEKVLSLRTDKSEPLDCC